MKPVLKTFLFLLAFNSFAQHKNVFLERSFWQENPNVETVKLRISEGNDATAVNENGFDAVVFALLEKADESAINYLLTLEGNAVDKRTHDSRIYLHWAAYAGHAPMVKKLLEMGSSTTALDSHGLTPLTFAAGAGLTAPEIYDMFIAKGVKLSEEKSQAGATTLLLAAPYLESVEDLEYFTAKGLSLKDTDYDGNGIFNYAARRGNVAFLQMLVKKGVDYKTPNKTGGNAFLFAAQGTRGFQNELPVYEYLKSLGLQPDVVTTDGYTPLHRLAFGTSDRAIFEFFLKAGADVNQQDAEGNTPFLNAASRNSLEIVQLLSKNVTDINQANKKGQTPLLLAVGSNSAKVAAFILEKGGNALGKDVEGNSAGYYLATSFNSKKPEDFDGKLQLLQKKGLKLDEVQGQGNTLYHVAAKENNLGLLKKLADFKIAPNKKNDEGLTALHIAAMKSDNAEIMASLIALGADKNVKTDFDETAYDLASENELLQKNNITLNFLK